VSVPLAQTGGSGSGGVVDITFLIFDGGNATSTYTMGTMQYDMGNAS
jgi:hypothetical protein